MSVDEPSTDTAHVEAPASTATEAIPPVGVPALTREEAGEDRSSKKRWSSSIRAVTAQVRMYMHVRKVCANFAANEINSWLRWRDSSSSDRHPGPGPGHIHACLAGLNVTWLTLPWSCVLHRQLTGMDSLFRSWSPSVSWPFSGMRHGSTKSCSGPSTHRQGSFDTDTLPP